jgi:hypothetical protein
MRTLTGNERIHALKLIKEGSKDNLSGMVMLVTSLVLTSLVIIANISE